MSPFKKIARIAKFMHYEDQQPRLSALSEKDRENPAIMLQAITNNMSIRARQLDTISHDLRRDSLTNAQIDLIIDLLDQAIKKDIAEEGEFLTQYRDEAIKAVNKLERQKEQNKQID